MSALLAQNRRWVNLSWRLLAPARINIPPMLRTSGGSCEDLRRFTLPPHSC